MTAILVLLFSTLIVAEYSVAHSISDELSERRKNIARFKNYEEQFPLQSAIQTFQGCDHMEGRHASHCIEIAIERQQ